MDASYLWVWLATPSSLYDRRLFYAILHAFAYSILPSIAGGLAFSFILIKKSFIFYNSRCQRKGFTSSSLISRLLPFEPFKGLAAICLALWPWICYSTYLLQYVHTLGT
ncbi:hypothetical protein D7X48_18830 [bacterium D16-50]|nr:hypothetical protein D7X48_18830 [bacterium D16-50]